MKKEQKIIELRRAAKLKVSELKTEISIAKSDTAGKKAHLLMLRAESLENTDEETDRYNVIANYRALIADENAKYAKKVAQLQALILQSKTRCERQCAAAEDDPETDTEKDNENDVKVKGFQPQQQTVYVDGSEHSARIVARRLINKMPHIPKDGLLYVHVVEDTYGDRREYFVSVTYGDRLHHETEIFSAQRHTAEFEAAFMEKVRRLFEDEPDSGNSHVAEPMASVLDAVFGGNPVEQVDNLISETFKDGKEGNNE